MNNSKYTSFSNIFPMAEMLHCPMKRQGNSVLFTKMYKMYTGESESGKESMKFFVHFPSPGNRTQNKREFGRREQAPNLAEKK